jgi:hypothetical protein
MGLLWITAAGRFEFDEDGNATHWAQPHDELVADALHSWKGDPSSMRIHMAAERAGEPEPWSGSGKQMRAQARALLHEIETNSRPNDRTLYRGDHREPGPHSEWSESRKVANHWARKGGGTVHVRKPGEGMGIRISDYINSQMNEGERGWILR